MRCTLPFASSLVAGWLPLILVICALPLGCKCSSRSGPRRGDYPSSLSYRPVGCAYDVTTPQATHASRDGTAVGPQATPSHVHVSFAGPPESSFVVNWRTGLATTSTQILVGTNRTAVGQARGAADGVAAHGGHTMLYTSTGDGNRQTRVHEAHVCGLAPAKRYFYKVGTAGAYSDVYDVLMAPAKGPHAAVRFAVFGDSRNNPAVFAAIQQRIREADAQLQLHTGDAVNYGPVQSQWNAMFEARDSTSSATDTLARIPMMMCNGNHDRLALEYLVQFAFPQELSAGEADPEQWYSFDYGNIHVVALDDWVEPTVLTSAERHFLESDLAAVDRQRTPWVFAVTHQPLYSCSAHGSNRALRRAWQPLFDHYRVDVVFHGHDHDYERSLPIRGFRADTVDGAIAAHGPEGEPIEQSGTVYIVAGGGGAPLYPASTDCYHTKRAVSVHSYSIVEAEERSLRLRTFDLEGKVLDELTVRRGAD